MKRSLDLTLVGALALASIACSDGGEPASEDTSSTDANGTTSPTGTPTSETSSGDVDGNTTHGDGSTGDTTTGEDIPDPATLPLAYIQGDPFPRLVIEIDAAPGFEPRVEATEQIPAALAEILDKPAGVEAVLDQGLASVGSDHAWTFAELDALSKETFDLPVDDDTVKMHVMFLDGSYTREDSGVILGLAWGRSRIAIFKETIESLCQGQVGMGLEERLCAGTERSVWVHELGHLLGLVDNGTPMLTSREDPDHPKHDVNAECVMYWAAERQNAIQQLAMNLVETDVAYLDFDDACLADIAAVRDE